MEVHQHIDSLAVQIGHDLLERADAARSRVWQKQWWLEQLTNLLDYDPILKTRAFQFVDCLPALHTNEAILRHLYEYFDPSVVGLPPIVTLAIGPGPLAAWRANVIGTSARFGARQMAGRFIAGFDGKSVLRTIERLRARRMAFTLDVLGESTTSYVQADAYVNVYHQLIEQLKKRAAGWRLDARIDKDHLGRAPRINLSIKLTGLDPHFDAIDPQRAIATTAQRLRPLLRKAREANAFVNIDMESTKHRAITFELFKTVLMEKEFRDWQDIGIVVQAYLRSGESDLADLLDWGKRRGTRFAVRLVKGAYWDAETAAAVRAYATPPVWTEKWQSDACFERMSQEMLRNSDLIRPAFASHNIRSLAVVMATARILGLTNRHYEIQLLYGMGDPLKRALVDLDQCIRVYCPYGDLMPGMGYLIRRLLENTCNDSFLKQGFGERSAYDVMLRNPTVAKPPSDPLPQRCYTDPESEQPMPYFTNASNTDFALEENRTKMMGALDYVRGEIGREYPMIINGEPVTTDEWFESLNPSHSDQIVGRIAQAGVSDVDRAVAAARKALAAWRRTSASERASILRQTAEKLEMRRFELAATVILEVGKPWREADADVTEAIDHCRYYAQQVERFEAHPRVRNVPGENNITAYSPRGVCAVIAPWAFPLAILSGMTTAALAAGNTLVIKPARKASILASKLVEILHDAGVPRGVVNIIPGNGGDIGPYLVEHEDVNLVAFTGSQQVGQSVIQRGALVRPDQGFIKKMIVEMGGKNAIIIDDDADLDGAMQATLASAFAFAGQKCSSASRLIVLKDVYESMLDRLTHATRSLNVGPAELPSTMVGPVVDKEAVDRINEYISIGRTEGRVIEQVELPSSCANGFYVAPIIFADVSAQARIAREEIFGPVLAVLRAENFDHAIQMANDTRYALTGGLFSRSPAHIDQARREFEVGNLYINRRITGSQVDAQPFGGFKLSGTGVKAGSPDYLLHFANTRCITENTQRSGLVPDSDERPVAKDSRQET